MKPGGFHLKSLGGRVGGPRVSLSSYLFWLSLSRVGEVGIRKSQLSDEEEKKQHGAERT